MEKEKSLLEKYLEAKEVKLKRTENLTKRLVEQFEEEYDEIESRFFRETEHILEYKEEKFKDNKDLENQLKELFEYKDFSKDEKKFLSMAFQRMNENSYMLLLLMEAFKFIYDIE